MIRTTKYVELQTKDKEDVAMISFEGDVLDILELRDYAEIMNENNHEFKNKCFRCNNDIVESDAENELCDMCDIVNNIMEEEKNEKDEDPVNHPAHYTQNGMECISEMIMLYGADEVMSFCKLNAHKYRKRALYKNGQEDMLKSDWYLAKYEELKRTKYDYKMAYIRELKRIIKDNHITDKDRIVDFLVDELYNQRY